MVNKVSVSYSRKASDNLNKTAVTVFPFGAFSEITFKNELSGKSCVLTDMAKISKNLSSVCFFGVDTDSYGLKRNSVVCAFDGKILGISDANRKSNEKTSVSYGYKIYNTDACKIGVLSCDDILNIDAIKCFSACECDLVVAVCYDFTRFRADYLIQTLSFLYGISICFFSSSNVYFSSPNGDLQFSSKEDSGEFLLSTKRNYTQYSIKQRGET